MDALAFETLKQQIRSADPKGLKSVFEQCSQYCIRTLIKKTQCSHADAEDILMEAVLTFRSNILADKVAFMSNLKTYMFGICWNKWRDMNRMNKRWDVARDQVQKEVYWTMSEASGYLKEQELDESRQEVELRLGAIQEGLKQLGEKCRRLLTYVYMEQRPMKDIAEMMDFANANVVKVTRFRCYKQWKKQIEMLLAPNNGK